MADHTLHGNCERCTACALRREGLDLAPFDRASVPCNNCGGTGLVAIRRGAVERHRRWMVRHYAVTLAPILFRLSLPLAIAGGLARVPAVGRACVRFALAGPRRRPRFNAS